MPEAEVTIQFVNQPKPGKKFGSIKASSGRYYGCPPAILALFTKGEVCKIEYEQQGEWFNLKRKISGAPPAAPNTPQVQTRKNPVDSEQIFIFWNFLD